ncbi:hypothetical protein HMPREF9451_01592 [Slackia piriformis YIT 12062]|uniref:Uncharacterized protein n=1 Tax=Slackia piriformis YIT 12062 TaxID=742818 RepID=K0YIV7_9ACTN|nr:hypothetical protein HMPREF9451_01592 [Slackia piriformis YIT 12062]
MGKFLCTPFVRSCFILAWLVRLLKQLLSLLGTILV